MYGAVFITGKGKALPGVLDQGVIRIGMDLVM